MTTGYSILPGLKYQAGRTIPMIIVPLLIFGIGAGLISLGFSAHNSEKSTRWDMPIAYSDSNYHTQNAKLFAADVKQCTDGELDIVVHGGGSLFKGGEIKRVVQTGQAPIGERLLSSHANENELYASDSIPFIASSFEDSDRLWHAARETLAELMDEENLVLLYSVPWPPSGMYFKHSVDSVADLERIKFRAYNAATARFAEIAGMIPVQIEAAELNQALALGVVESLMSSGSTGYDRKVWEQLSHFYDVKSWLPRNYVFANKDEYHKLSEANRNCLHLAATRAEATGTARAEELGDWYLEQLAANGMLIHQPGAGLTAELSKIGRTMTDEWLQKTGTKGAAILQAYNSK